MRLFVAVDIDEPVRELCRDVARTVSRRLAKEVPGCDLKWVEPANLHITMRFIGHVDDARAAQIVRLFDRPLRAPALTAAIEAPAVFPPGGAPRVIWLGIGEGRSELADVHREVESRLAAAGLEPEGRAFAPHLTLARFRSPVRAGGAAIRRVLAATAVPARKWTVSHVTLYESKLSSKGPTYMPVARAALDGPVEQA